MKTKTALSVLLGAAFFVGSIGCGATNIVSENVQQNNEQAAVSATSTPTPAVAVLPATPSPTPLPSAAPGVSSSSQAASSSSAGPSSVGPNPADVPQGYNPLTGLPASDPSLLSLPAVLISITNFPPSSRPQSGLSFAPWVFEIYISEGMTRFLATFYGDFPHSGQINGLLATQPGNPPVNQGSGQGAGQGAGQGTGQAQTQNQAVQPPSMDVGPVRSGRLPYVYIHSFFQDSCLVYAGATYQIRSQLRGCASVFGSDSTNVNSAMLDVSRLQKIAEQNQQTGHTFNYTGNLFSSQAAAQGAPANVIDIFYSFLNQAQWQFDSAVGKYLRFDDFADGSGKFKPATDRLTGQQLAFSNVIVLFAEHDAIQPYIIDIKLDAGEKGKAVVFRDGQRFDVFWTTVAGPYEQTTGLRRPIRFVDANGNPFALKPGNSWVHVVTIPSDVIDKGNATWLVRFYAPAGAK